MRDDSNIVDKHRGLTAERLREILYYDADTGIFTWIEPTGKRVNVGDVAGSKNSTGYIVIMIGGKEYRSHRLAWLYMTGLWPKDEIDHINRVRNDNRFVNLREASRYQNCINKKQYGSGRVTRSGAKYLAKITIPLGYFDTEEEARAAYMKAANDNYGEFVAAS